MGHPSLVGLSWRRRAGAFLVVSVLLSGLLAEVAVTASGATESSPAEDPGRGVINRGIRVRDPAGPCGRTRPVDVPGPPACTHGPDAAPSGIDVRLPRDVETVRREAAEPQAQAVVASEPSTAATDPAAVPCYGDGVSGNRVQLVYARASGVADRFAQVAPSLQLAAAQVDSVFNTSATETGGTRHVRYVTDASCKATVAQVVLTATGDDTFNNTIT